MRLGLLVCVLVAASSTTFADPIALVDGRMFVRAGDFRTPTMIVDPPPDVSVGTLDPITGKYFGFSPSESGTLDVDGDGVAFLGFSDMVETLLRGEVFAIASSQGVYQTTLLVKKTVDDLIISGGPGELVAEFSFNHTLSGSLSAVIDTNQTIFGGGGLTVRAGARVISPGSAGVTSFSNIPSANAYTRSLSFDVRRPGDPLLNFEFSFFYTITPMGAGTVSLQSTTFEVPTNTPLTVEYYLGLLATINIRDGTSVELSANYFDTFGLPTSGTVFNLEPGFTANSVQLGVADNRLVVDEPEPKPVPEPGGLVLLAIALSAVWALRIQPR